VSTRLIVSFVAAGVFALAACNDTRTRVDARGAGGAAPGAGGKSAGSGGANTSSGGASTSSGGSGAGAGTGTGGASSGSGGKSASSGGASSGGASSGGASTSSGGSTQGSGGATGNAFHCPPGPFGSPVASGASAERVDGVPPADSFNDSGNTRTNVEGSVWIGDKLYVSEFQFMPAPTSRVLAIAPAATGSAATVSVAIPSCGANGLAVDSAGNLIATDHKLGALLRVPFPLGTTTPATIVGTYDGKRFNSPNDLAIRSDGNIYFSDPNYQAPSPAPQSATRVYRVAPGASEVTVIDANRSQPNGVTLSADERTLYVSGSDGIFSYPVQTDGSVGSGKRLDGFTAGGSDGMAMDCAGNLYATAGKRVVVLSPAGMEIGSVSVNQADQVTNVAFGGADHKTLFITSMGTGTSRGIFRATLNVPGFPY
jgi:gluconolactonase